VAGPISQVEDKEQNALEAIDIGQKLVDLGYSPFIPQMSYWWQLRHPNDWQTWLDMDLTWIVTCDGLLALRGPSDGRDLEVAEASRLGIPVVWSVKELREKVPAGQPEAGLLPQPVSHALDKIATIFARKNSDYSDDSSWDSNFVDVGRRAGLPKEKIAEVLIELKRARLRALDTSGREPQNEATSDTILDHTVYSVIELAMALEAAGT